MVDDSPIVWRQHQHPQGAPREAPSGLPRGAGPPAHYRPGEVGQVDWWHTGWHVPVGRGVTHEAFGLVAMLPWCGVHATVFTHGRTVGDLRPALTGRLERLGGVPAALVYDNDPAVVAERVHG